MLSKLRGQQFKEGRQFLRSSKLGALLSGMLLQSRYLLFSLLINDKDPKLWEKSSTTPTNNPVTDSTEKNTNTVTPDLTP